MCPEEIGTVYFSFENNTIYWTFPSFKILERKMNSRIWSPGFHFEELLERCINFKVTNPYRSVGLHLDCIKFNSWIQGKVKFGFANNKYEEITCKDGQCMGSYFAVADFFTLFCNSDVKMSKYRVFCEVSEINVQKIKHNNLQSRKSTFFFSYVPKAAIKAIEDYKKCKRIWKERRYKLNEVQRNDFRDVPKATIKDTEYYEDKNRSPKQNRYQSVEVQSHDFRNVPKATVKAIEYYEIDNYNPRTNRYESDEEQSHDFRNLEKLSQNFRVLYLEKHDTDLVLMVKDREFKVHKGILRSRLPVFNAMFSHELLESNSGIVPIEDCEPAAFEEFLLFVYTGRTHITSENVCELYYIADKYEMQDLKEECVRFLKKCLSIETICDVICLSTKHNERKLLDFAIPFFARNMEEILVTIKWQLFLKENPTEANELIIKALKLGFTKRKI